MRRSAGGYRSQSGWSVAMTMSHQAAVTVPASPDQVFEPSNQKQSIISREQVPG
jgi:hypothetical protein